MDSSCGRLNEWYFVNSFFRVTGDEKDWGMLASMGVIRSQEELQSFLKIARFGPEDPFYRRDAWEVDIDPDTIDFTKCNLVWLADMIESGETETRRIEDVTENFKCFWMVTATSPLTPGEKEARDDNSNAQLRVQSVHVVCVPCMIPGMPVVEDTGAAYSRTPADI